MGERRKRSRLTTSPHRNPTALLLKDCTRATPSATPQQPEEEAAVLKAEVQDLEQEVRNLQSANKQLREEVHELMEFSPVGYLTLSAAGGIESLNRTAAALLGRERQLLRTHPFPAFVAEDSVSAFFSHLAKVQREGGKQAMEITINRPDKSVVHFIMESKASRDRHHRLRIRSSIVDVTERKRLEEERRRLEEQLSQAHKMEAIGTLAGGIAHDFNNILAAIVGYAEMLTEEVTDPVLRRKVERVLKAGLRGKDLVRQILAFSRKSEGERKAVSLTHLVEEAHGLLRASLPSSIKMQCISTTTEDYVCADPAQLQQVVLNLATNAADAMQETGGELTLECSSVAVDAKSRVLDPGMRPGAYVKLSVKDTGTGMTESVRQKAFDPFFTTKAKGKGTGMGLAVVYGVVKNHGGAITVHSTVGGGSIFEVLLPRVAKPEKTEEKSPASPAPKGTEHILLADDEEPLVQMGKAMLETLGYDVTVARDGREAWNLFTRDPSQFDAVITDQTMPDMTGVVLAQKVLAVRKDMPIILCTGYSEAVSAEKAKEVGIAAFVMKPVVKKELAETIRKVLDSRKAEA